MADVRHPISAASGGSSCLRGGGAGAFAGPGRGVAFLRGVAGDMAAPARRAMLAASCGLFACDYAFSTDDDMKLNPYGEREATVAGGRRLLEIARELRPRLVAGWNYVCEGGAWTARFERALARAAG